MGNAYRVLLIDWDSTQPDKDGCYTDVASMIAALKQSERSRGPFYLEFPPFTAFTQEQPGRVDPTFIGATVRVHDIECSEDGRVRVWGRMHITGGRSSVLNHARAGKFLLTPVMIVRKSAEFGKLTAHVDSIVSFRFHHHGEWESFEQVYSDWGLPYTGLPPLCWKVWSEEPVVAVQRRIVSAAVRLKKKDGSSIVVMAARHGSPGIHPLINTLVESGQLETDWAMGEDQGFTDQFDDYFTREEAFIIAQAARQLEGRKKTGGKPDVLYSEDLY
jgi:hypothetical protein